MRLNPKSVASTALGVLLVLTVLQAVAREPEAQTWKKELPVRDAYLRTHMPDNAGAYVRIPDLFGFFTMPKGNSLDAALRSKANVENVLEIRRGLIENVLRQIPALSDTGLPDIIDKLRSPVEVVLMTDPAPAALVAVNLGFESRIALEEALDALGKVNPVFRLTQPLDDQGLGIMTGPGSPVFLKFDDGSGQLFLSVGPAVSLQSFEQTLAGLQSGTAQPVRVMESRIDESGQGLFIWLDGRRVMPTLQAFLQPEQLASHHELGLDQVESLAFGWGVAGGKGRLSLIADLAKTRDRGLLPIVSNDLGARSAGEPDALMTMSIPAPQELSRLEASALAKASPESAVSWGQFKDAIETISGIRVEEFFEAVGPDLDFIFDQAGEYAALKLRDARMFDSIVARLTENTGVSLEQRTIARKTYFHFAGPPGALSPEMEGIEEDEAEAPAWVQEFMTRDRLHVYWTRDGDYLYLSSTPQVLIDRASLNPRQEVGAWLQETQKIDARNAALSFSGTSEKLPRRIYGIYLEILQYLADLGQVEMDIWAMPTPAQLGLSRLGTLGFTLNLGDPTIGAELTFENNPAEMLGGAGGVAIAGILAAIAIPAYQDYTHRAQVGEGLILGGNVRTAVTEHYMNEGRFPDVGAAASLSLPENAGQYTRSVTVEPFSGRITIDYLEDVLPAGGEVYLRPKVEQDGSISWQCSATIDDKFLPASCRSE